MTFKSTTQPLCRCCGKPIPKRTTTQYFGGSDRPSIGGRLPHFPKDKAEAQRLVNQQIVSLRYSRTSTSEWRVSSDPGFDYVDWVSLWDGESYKDQWFCGDPCAVSFAYAHARAGHTCKGYADAIAKEAAA